MSEQAPGMRHGAAQERLGKEEKEKAWEERRIEDKELRDKRFQEKNEGATRELVYNPPEFETELQQAQSLDELIELLEKSSLDVTLAVHFPRVPKFGEPGGKYGVRESDASNLKFHYTGHSLAHAIKDTTSSEPGYGMESQRGLKNPNFSGQTEAAVPREILELAIQLQEEKYKDRDIELYDKYHF